MDWEPTPETCPSRHQPVELALGLVVTLGIVLSYLPQHYRIIKNQSSDGLSALFLLLGGTSATASLCCVVLLQWRVIRCCSVWTAAQAAENLLGMIQVALVCLMFNVIIILYIVYFPGNLRYTTDSCSTGEETPLLSKRTRTRAYKAAWTAVILVYLHLAITLILSIYFLLPSRPPKIAPGDPALPPIPQPPPDTKRHSSLMVWTTFLGTSAALLGSFQYLPQIYTTLRHGKVGALSIPTMAMQCPGSFIFVATLAGRQGVDWTGWIAYAATGTLQGTLLVICLILQRREATLASTDFDDTDGAIRPTRTPAAGQVIVVDHSPGERARIVSAE